MSRLPRHLSAYTLPVTDSPGPFGLHSPFAIGAWFGPQQILEVLYLKELYYPSGGKVEAITLDLAPYFTLGNLMIGTWPFFVSGRAGLSGHDRQAEG